MCIRDSISPPENRVLIKKKMAELDPAANPGAPVIPQLLAKDGALAAWMIGELRKICLLYTSHATMPLEASTWQTVAPAAAQAGPLKF